MKRSPLLQPLSREHHAALSLARSCERAARSGDAAQIDAACERAVRAFRQQLDPHFRTEEHALLPLLRSADTQPLVQRTLEDHRLLRGLLDDLQRNDAGALARFGEHLAAHVRFEERALFAAIESLL
ncbi:hemerythrin domain-containing protein [Thiobacillus sp.]|uniref:hemerythrin domain-containing protein n=1 Tax=Thiobacillus sp. TaxID=924 RepID=UPI0025D69B1E|nr:hemerythrin domain-containing protein [Thiobacillus sp.]